MATIVLGAVGGALGGPIGAAIGTVLGRQADNALFPAKARQGPRLTELAVQTSSYGNQIPKLFGTIRVAGTVLWSTDLIERRSSEGGGKGQPRTTTYSYAASFAVLLSSRPIRSVRRIWAEGKLLRGAAGDWKVRCGFRLHSGGEDQAADPLIAASEGVARTPAHRGTAYAVFEDLPLSEFGNRIPSLTFEVEADTGPVTVGHVIEAVSNGAIAAGEGGPMLGGYSAHGGSVRAVVDSLAEPTGCWFVPTAAGLSINHGGGPARAIRDDGVRGEGARGGARSRTVASAAAAPRLLTLAHYDPARDYQVGVQRAVRPGPGERSVRIELPAVLDAAAAAGMAAAAAARIDLDREGRTTTLGWSALDIVPGERVTVGQDDGLWRVAHWTFRDMTVGLRLKRVTSASMPAVSATSGRIVSAVDAVHGPTLLHLIELPPEDDVVTAVPRLAVAAAGTVPGWRRAALIVGDGSGGWREAGSTAAPAIIGTTLLRPVAGPITLEDRKHSIDVELAHAEMSLSGADERMLQAGANAALVGGELLQFGVAERLSARRWRLSRLWRGRRGSDAAVDHHVAGERFVLLDAATLAPISAVGDTEGVIRVRAVGIGDHAEGVEATIRPHGLATLPMVPVHLRATVGDDRLDIRWVRRSRAGWAWRDGVDVPLVEERERYAVTLLDSAGEARQLVADVPLITLAATGLALPIRIEVRQVGTNGMSPPAVITIGSGRM